MRKNCLAIFIVGVICLSAVYAFAQEGMYVFPKKGQSKQKQSKDVSSCEVWAEKETGVDPSYVKGKLSMIDEVQEVQTGQRRRGPGGDILRGAARGAAMGAIDDAIDNEVGSRAAQGALAAGMRSRQRRQYQAAAQKQQNAIRREQNLEQEYNDYLRAFSACMEAKDYSVK